MTSTRNAIMQKGLFPETLPPCFDSSNIIKSFHGIISSIEGSALQKGRSTKYARYIGTKHDGNRRFYATPNPISYYSIAQFIQENQKSIFKQYQKSSFSISAPQMGSKDADRAITINSLSELSERLSAKVRYAPFILKTDIAQFFPSIYTHVIPWLCMALQPQKMIKIEGLKQ